MHNCSQNIGIDNKCIRPIHTLEKNVIHIGYSRSYPFTLNHFLYIWGIDRKKYDLLGLH